MYPNGGHRQATWDFRCQLSCQMNALWCIYGDFNYILDASEKRGRSTRSNWLINGFRQVDLDSRLFDISADGYPFI
jgi:hypothetical protein